MDIEDALNEINLRVCDLVNSIRKYQNYIDDIKEPTGEHLIFSTMMVIAANAAHTVNVHIKKARKIIKKPPAATDGVSKKTQGRKVNISVNEKGGKVK